MAPRSDEPRRDKGVSRRGSSRSTDSRSTDDRADAQDRDREPPGRASGGRGGGSAGDAGWGGISDARAYTPRGRTVRDEPGLRRTPRSGRSGDPFRPALQVLDGGRTTSAKATAKTTAKTTATPRRTAAGPVRDRNTDGVRRASSGTASGRSGAETAVKRSRPSGTGTASGRSGAESAIRRSRLNGRLTSPGAGPRTRRKPPRPPRLADPRRRLRVGTLLALTLFAVIGIRLVVLQVVPGPAYATGALADRLHTVTLPAPRGAIYDRSGVALAHSLAARYVYADPELVAKEGDRAAAATALSPLLGIPRSELAERMARRKHPGGTWSTFEYLARGVDIETAKKIAALELDGIGTGPDERREVPGKDLAANLIGFTGQDMFGLEGLEARYDELLRGVNGEHVYEAGLGAAIPGGYNKVTEAQPGSSLVLTIDRDLQYKVQQVLSQAMRDARGSKAAAIVLDRNGEVLAQASHPTYNAAAPLESKSADREDVATSFVVDPGSVHKALVFGAALEEKVITPQTVLPIPSQIVKGDRPFPDTHPANGRRMSLPGMLGHSSNVGTIKIADALTARKLYDYQLRFGLGEPTGVGVPGEAAGRVLAPSEWSGSSYGSVPIGHSVDVTPLQMAAAYAAIANDGTWVQPHLVRETIAPDGKRTPAPPPKTRQVLSPENAAALRTMLEAVVTLPDGTGTRAAIRGYRVAGKTGTGKRIVDGRYVSGEVASFIGMAPADKPRYVIAVFAYTPSGGGGDVAAPAFRDMMAFTLRHYRVPPTGTTPPKFTVYPR